MIKYFRKYSLTCLVLILPGYQELRAQAYETEWQLSHHYKHAQSLSKALETPLVATHVYIDNYTDSVFPSNEILQMPHLEYLIVDGRFCREHKQDPALPALKVRIDTARLHQLTELKYLEITRMDFSTFPEGLCTLPNLKGLDLAICMIREIPPSIARLKSLEGLDLRLNNISSLPPEIAQLEHLELLYLQNNNFTSIPQTLTGMKALRTLELLNVEADRAAPEIDYHWPYPIQVNAINVKAQYELIRQWIAADPLHYMSISLPDCSDLPELNRKLKLDGIYKSVYLSSRGCKK